jgi:hypothetical protein
MTRDQFINLYSELRPQHLQPTCITTGFRNTGIYPISIKPLEKHFRQAPIDELERQLQTRTQNPQQVALQVEDRGLQLKITGILTNEPADTSAIGEKVFIQDYGSCLRINPQASYHAVCDQLLIEPEADRRAILIQAIRNWCERQELKVKTYKYAGNLFYQATVDNKRAAVEAKDRTHLGLGKVIDRDAWQAIQQRKKEEEVIAMRLKEEKEIAKRTRQLMAEKKRDAASKKREERAQKRPLQASTPTPAKRRRIPHTTSQLSQVQSYTEWPGEMYASIGQYPPPPSVLSDAASSALSYLGGDVVDSQDGI